MAPQRLKPDLCIIGGGSGGLSLAAGAAQIGASVVLIERAEMGGDCLNVGCVPSKSLLAAAHHAQAARNGAAFGVRSAGEPVIDAAAVREHVKGVIAKIAPHDSVERFEGLGVKVIQAEGRFTGPGTVEAGGHTIEAKRFAIATGSRPVVPPIPGLKDAPYLTNETFFDTAPAFDHLLIIGGGTIGVEMAQASRRLGAEVTVVEGATLMNREDPDLVGFVRERLVAEGVTCMENAKVKAVEGGQDANAVALVVEGKGGEERVLGSHVLVAVGRAPTLDALNLKAAGVEFDKTGVKVDARLRTSNKRVFALGDAKGAPMFTHAAGHEAGVVFQNALFRLPAKAAHHLNPRVTFTDPELAQVGMTEPEAEERHGRDVEVLRWSYGQNDRGMAEREDGLIKVVLVKGKVAGVGIAGARAGDLLPPWQLVMAGKAKLKDVAQMTMPYPTLSEVSKRAAGSRFTPKLFGSASKKVVSLLKRLP